MKMAAIVVDTRLFLVKEEVCFTWNDRENGSHVVDSRLFLVKEEVYFTWNGRENGSNMQK